MNIMERTPDTVLQGEIDAARKRTLGWFDGLAPVEDCPPGVMRIDAALDAALWPGMLIPGTYNGILCLNLLDGLQGWSVEQRRDMENWFYGFRQADGAFRLPGLTAKNAFKKSDPAETWRYIDFHVTNYTMGALEALGAEPAAPEFVQPYLEPMVLKSWLSDRDLRDPWQEGNNIVNLASFLLVLDRNGDATTRTRIAEALRILFDWHDRHQDPETGFWGSGQHCDPTRLLHAMAGSMHNFHLYYACDRPLPYQARAVDYVLGRPTTWHSACIDVDEVDLLIHAAPNLPGLPDRQAAIGQWLRGKLRALLDNQNRDGGFADTLQSGWRQDGWIGGYEVEPGASTTFATWFRWIAIAMIDDHLWPGRRQWNFRRMIGIGYRKPSHD